jgi:hypothetical protein
MISNKLEATDMFDYIQGDKFRDLCTWTYSPKEKAPRDDYDNLPNTLDVTKLKDGDVIYTHMMYAQKLLAILEYFSKTYVLVTHSCDCSVEDYGIRRPNGKGETKELHEFVIPDNLIIWHSKNVNTINPRIVSIPIGIENARWHEKVNKPLLMENQLRRLRGVRNLAYMNHSIKTNPLERKVLYDLFNDKKWVTKRHGSNGEKFERYIHQMYNHKFIFSPEGNGIDTIRTWEALYMGTIPIEKRNLNNRFYTDLPICFVDSWEQVTEEFLNKEYKRIKATEYNLDKLQFKYWANKIMEE